MDFTEDSQFVIVEGVNNKSPLLMNNPSIIGMVVGIIAEAVGDNEWGLDDDFSDDLGLDSVSFVELIFNTEDVFKIRLNEFDMENIVSPQELINYVEWKLGI